MATSEIVKKALEALEKAGCANPATPARNVVSTSEPSSFCYEARRNDLYWLATMAAWQRIAENARLPGAMRWAERNRPALYHKITHEMPAQWEHLWDSGAPIDQFQAALNCWVEGHKQLQELYVSTGPKS